DEIHEVDDANKENENKFDQVDDTNKENEFNQVENPSVSKYRGCLATKYYKLATETKKSYVQNITIEHVIKQDIIL
ncbi:6675_t:CDS:1, partial [Gigaspora margarita]